jgi:hypothetical protein
MHGFINGRFKNYNILFILEYGRKINNWEQFFLTAVRGWNY